MVKGRGAGWASWKGLALGVLLIVPGPSPGQEAGPVEPTTGPVAEEVSEALSDLDEAGVPPSDEDSREFVKDLITHPRPSWGALSLRMGYKPGTGANGSLGFTLGPGPWHVRARMRHDGTGVVARSAVAGWDHPSVTLRLGYLGFRHGFGLLMAPPGRSASLGADQSLGPGSARMVGWTGTVDHRTRLGLGCGLNMGRWRFHGLVGVDPEAADTGGTPLKFLRAAVGGEKGQVAAAALHTGTSRAVSLGGVLRGDGHEGSTEGVLWLNPRGEAEGWAVVAHGSWSPLRAQAVEASWAVADREGTWTSGARPAVLPTWSGHGYALRFRSSPGPGMSVRGLWHQGWALPGAGSGERFQRRVTELQGNQRVAEGWELSLRYRRSSDTDWIWSRRHPWLPAVPTPADIKTVVTAKLTHEKGMGRVSVMVRTLDRQAPGASGRRSLLGLEGRLKPHRDWTLRYFAATAWGEDVDLVSAVVPFAGLVLPRHWGKWRSETGLGISRTGARWTIRLAGGVRRPEPGRGEETDPWVRAAMDLGW